MINPLQAMQLARKANQMGGLGVTSHGAQTLTPLLQQAQLNVAAPQNMPGTPARLMEMDKHRYTNAALDRDQRNREAVWNVMDAERGRQQQAALEAQRLQQQSALEAQRLAQQKYLTTTEWQLRERLQNESQQAAIDLQKQGDATALSRLDKSHENNLALEQERNANNLALQESGVTKSIEAERGKLELQRKAEIAKEQLMQQMRDKRYGGLRAGTKKVFDDYTGWIGGKDQEFVDNAYNESIDKLSMARVTPEEVNAHFAGKGYQPSAYPQYGDDNYKKVAKNLYLANPAFEDERATELQLAQRSANEITVAKSTAYSNSMQALGKLGFSIPEDPATGQPAPQVQGSALVPGQPQASAPQTPTQVATPQHLPSPISFDKNGNLIAKGPSLITDDGGDDERSDVDVNPDYFWVDPYTGKKGILPVAGAHLVDAAGELVMENGKAIVMGTTASGVLAKLAMDHRLNVKMDKAVPLDSKGNPIPDGPARTGGSKNPTSYKKNYLQLQHRKAITNLVDEFVDGGLKGLTNPDTNKPYTPKDLDNMTIDQAKDLVRSSREGFLKRVSTKIGNNFYMKDKDGNVIKENGKPKTFKLPQILKTLGKGAGYTGLGFLAWDLMTSLSPAERKRLIAEATKIDQTSNQVLDASMEGNKTDPKSGLQYNVRIK